MKFDLNDYLQLHRASDRYPNTPRIVCRDGFSISVKANWGSYCVPRDCRGPYTHVECGFPSWEPEFIMAYCQDPKNPTNTIYCNVPVDLVEKLILLHGGFSIKIGILKD